MSISNIVTSLTLFQAQSPAHRCKQLMTMHNVPVNVKLWSCRNVTAILWDFYPKLGCHDTQKVLKTSEITLFYAIKRNAKNNETVYVCIQAKHYKMRTVTNTIGLLNSMILPH